MCFRAESRITDMRLRWTSYPPWDRKCEMSEYNNQDRPTLTLDEWKDALLLREFQTVRERDPLEPVGVDDRSHRLLRDYFGITPLQFQCLTSAVNGTRCPHRSPCPFEGTSAGWLVRAESSDSNIARACTPTVIGAAYYYEATRLLEDQSK